MRIYVSIVGLFLALTAAAITFPSLPTDMPATSPIAAGTELPGTSASAQLSGVFMLHPAGEFQSCMSWIYERENDPYYPTTPWSKPRIKTCEISGPQVQSYQVVVEDIFTGKSWDGKTKTKVTIQNRQQQGCFTNPDEDIFGTRAVYGKEVHLEPCGHPFEGRGESQRQVWEIEVDPVSGNAAIATDIGNVLLGATRECLQNYGNIKPVRTPCTGEFFWQFQPVLH